MASVTIQIQTDDFNVAEEYDHLRSAAAGAGAVVLFVGLVRDFSPLGSVHSMELEHYPAMTRKVLASIAEQAQERWPYEATIIRHRVGRLDPADQIVLVGVASQHRAEAFAAAEFIMDYLKTQAPFWKKEIDADGNERWVAAKGSDQRALERW